MPNVAFLETYADAWNRHDLDAIMAAMTTNTIFIPSSNTRIKPACHQSGATPLLSPNRAWKPELTTPPCPEPVPNAGEGCSPWLAFLSEISRDLP